MKNKDKKTILVTGATGKQGGAVARHLVNYGWHVRLLSRDPDKPAVKPFLEMGVEIARGNLDDYDSVLSAARGAYGIYSVQSLEQGTDVECRQGKLLATAFHPELTDDLRFHKYFLDIISNGRKK